MTAWHFRPVPPAIGATVLLALAIGPARAGAPTAGPYNRQVAEKTALLAARAPAIRARAAEALGFLRAYQAEDALIRALDDPAADVRRQAAMALAWSGGRKAMPRLLDALNDDDWVTRQAAHVALTNLTGMEFSFDAMAAPSQRAEQARKWRQWWAGLPADRPPPEVLALLAGPKNLARGAAVTASSTYRGPTSVLTDGQIGRPYWQTKNVRPPQWCQIDLGRPQPITRVVVHQYGPGYCLTEYELAVSLDNKLFDAAVHEKGKTPVDLSIEFKPCQARYVRITSFGSEKPQFPTTFFEVEIFGAGPATDVPADQIPWRQERGVRALGVLGGQGATEAILELLGPAPSLAQRDRPTVRSAIRALGRLRQEAGFRAMVTLLDSPMWARFAADALGDFGDRRAVPALLAAYPHYAKRLDGKDPADVPRDDHMSFPSEDRMLETPYWIAYALCRLPLDRPEDRAELARLAPRIMANLPGDHDTFMLYQPEAGHLLTRHLMELSGRRQEAIEHALTIIRQPPAAKPKLTLKSLLPVVAQTDPGAWPVFRQAQMATWLPALCTDPADLPRLLPLLEHQDGWVRINAAKAIAWLGDRRAIEPIAKILAQAEAEADYGYSPLFKDEEYDDPCPRWREALVRALGLLGTDEHAPLLVKILDDERSVLEVRHAAAEALADLGTPAALSALRKAALSHSFYSVRHVARDAIEARGIELVETIPAERPPAAPEIEPSADFGALVFIKGDNDLPNSKRTVEQADRWRQTYIVTDEGPVYRPGNNLFLLSPPRPDGRVTPLTRFADGYVGEPEVSWDAKQVIFTHRGQADPWWHVWRIDVDGTHLTRLTDGPYHDVGPAYLPDGRIVFASSRLGIRDEYHGYPCTSLYVMNADGSDLHPIAVNIGRDNEPALLPDGRIVFSRLEVFYSRNKTELTLHAMLPDGTHDTVLYGPERRTFWRMLDHGMPGPDDGQEAPLTHRVLRMTQPQPMPDGRQIIVSTQGGLTLIGSRHDRETIITPDSKTRAYTTPLPLPDGSILCASTLKTPDRKQVDLGLYRFYPATGKLELIYNDPATADYEARPIMARRPPPTPPELTRRNAYSGRFLCTTAFASQEPEVKTRGRLVRLVEGTPVVGRHATHTGPEPVWKNHGGTLARVLGTAPLAADGSFYLELPADRLVHLQVLDSDRRVVGNQLTWIYARPGETKSCVGCHENPHITTVGNNPLASHGDPLRFLPNGQEFSYRAKAWFKGSLPPEIEERTRTVRAVNLLGR